MARNHRSFRGGPRRATDWSASTPQSDFVAVVAATAVLLEMFIPIVGGETVICTHGIFGWLSDQVSVDEDQMGAFGICVVTAQAVSVGITAIPHPATDAAWGGWLLHTFFQSKLEVLSAVGIRPDIMHNMVLDSKAMRKVDEDERLVVVVENTDTGFGIRVGHSERFLSKVH